MSPGKTWCDCVQNMVSVDQCNSCNPDFDDDVEEGFDAGEWNNLALEDDPGM